MTFRKIVIIGLVIAAMVLPGCVQREIVMTQQNEAVPDVTIKSDIEIDWEQVMSDCEASLNAEEFPKGQYLDFAVHEETDEEPAYTEIIWPVSNDMSEEEATAYAVAYAKAFNDAIAIQDFSYAMSTDDTYGGYWDLNNMYVQVFRDKDILDPECYLVNQYIPAGNEDEIVLQSEMTAASQEAIPGEE